MRETSFSVTSETVARPHPSDATVTAQSPKNVQLAPVDRHDVAVPSGRFTDPVHHLSFTDAQTVAGYRVALEVGPRRPEYPPFVEASISCVVHRRHISAFG